MSIQVNFICKTEIKKGLNALKAAKEAKVKIKAPCDGKGKCGKCLIRILDGDVSEPTKQEKKLLSKSKLEKGYRLACETTISQNTVIEIPEKS
ncbi:2Fe-2S iron-sulfur cluster binding domain-containing protein [Geosporobacter subterraneus DSM 17957]|uniref:2Fe-2S iron-sulfur cluster binding domain-containing protein n=1 Tax=Geosporobacter subterraneus DSM 17957 TaxID=1121919 RepID=A0A1M6FJH9_9FIRM|nr:2Fe-2S iron-sulfur cluster-binding protein [Geosporobacter subterraneus]SHI97835.1 2Fe-2S iron-sulfur cluster binding domain-containing protein [Geosporobacter subterraneus DSM 17957]